MVITRLNAPLIHSFYSVSLTLCIFCHCLLLCVELSPQEYCCVEPRTYCHFHLLNWLHSHSFNSVFPGWAEVCCSCEEKRDKREFFFTQASFQMDFIWSVWHVDLLTCCIMALPLCAYDMFNDAAVGCRGSVFWTWQLESWLPGVSCCCMSLSLSLCFIHTAWPKEVTTWKSLSEKLRACHWIAYSTISAFFSSQCMRLATGESTP